MTEPHAVYARTVGANTVADRTLAHTFGPSRLSWQGIIAGVVTALAVQVVLGLVGAAIGLGMVHEVNPAAAPTANEIGVGAMLWTAVSMLVAIYYGSFIAARVSRHVTRTDGVVQGIVVWASTLLLTVTVLSGTVGSLGAAAQTPPAPRPMAERQAPPAPMAQNGAPSMQAPTPAQAQADDRMAHDAAKGTGLAAIVFLLGALVAAFGGRLGTDHANEGMLETRTTNIEV